MTEISSSPFQQATFAGGCFWCIEAAFAHLDGVISVTSGYTGGHLKNPTYQQVHSDETGHREAVRVTYDQTKLPYLKLLETYWQQIDPTDTGGQFADRGHLYTTAIFYHNDSQKRQAEASKQSLHNSSKFENPIATEILPAQDFYPAEDDHQQYAQKHPTRYQLYKTGSGRQNFIDKHWAK